MANILVIGLNQGDAKVLDCSLEKSGFNIEYAMNYSFILNIVNTFTPDVLLCIHNPGKFDGFEFLKASASHPTLKNTRKIFISEQNDRSSFRNAMALGADDFIPQPYTIIEITDAIDIQRQRTQALNDQLSSVHQKDEQSSLITQAQLKENFSALNHQTNLNKTTTQLYLLGIDQLNWLKITLGSSVSNTIIEVFSNRLIASRKALGVSFAIASIDNQEFAILADPGQATKVEACLDELWQQSIATPIAIEGQEIQITTSMAAIEFQLQDGCDLDMIMGQARQVLRHINKNGGNQLRSETFCPKSKSSYQFAIATNLTKGLAENEFHAYYQPQVDLKTGKFVGVEALVRWHHHEWGNLEPGRFIPIAEETALITQIDERVLHLACQAIQHWKNTSYTPLKVSVNLSALSFNRPNLKEVVENILLEFDVSPEWLELEITESMLVQDAARAAEIMKDLKSIGISIALDDFGIGYSSLSYLQLFPIDTLKIDRCFIHHVDLNRGNAAITEAVIKLAHDLGLRVVAEGVERVQEREFLSRLHCDAMQGYLVSHPVPQSVFETLLSSQLAQPFAIA